jgi:hypothetical protein
MAYTMRVPDPRFMGVVYNVTRSVGPGQPNIPSDVMLVQYLLHKIYSHPRNTAPPIFARFTVDGSCGPVTQEMIRTFQRDMEPRRWRTFADGIVDSATPELVARTRDADRSLTILTMNHIFHGYYRDLYPRLPTASDLPAPLAAALGRVR